MRFPFSSVAVVALGLTALCHDAQATVSLRRVGKAHENQRKLASYYHTVTTDVLGAPNPDATIGNPLKGLVESPIYMPPPYKPDLPVAVEFYYLGKRLQCCSYRVDCGRA
jgi:hypothetical protein